MPKLKFAEVLDPHPCLYCGSEDLDLRRVRPEVGRKAFITVLCKGCGATGPLGKTEDEAVRLYNKLHEDSGQMDLGIVYAE